MVLPLATVADAASYGMTATVEALEDASQRVRDYCHRDFEAGTYMVEARGPRFRLPQRPVGAVTSVVDADGVVIATDRWKLRVGGWLEVPTTGWVTVAYTCTGAVPAGLVRIVCQVASRVASQPAALADGAQQQTVPGMLVTYGWDAYANAAGLTTGERRAIDRVVPRGGRGPIVMRTQ